MPNSENSAQDGEKQFLFKTNVNVHEYINIFDLNGLLFNLLFKVNQGALKT